MARSRRLTSLCVIVAAFYAGCGLVDSRANFDWLEQRPAHQAGFGPVRFAWAARIVPEWDTTYVPVERAAAAVDPTHDRVYVGSSARGLWAMNGGGGRVYRYDSRAAIEGRPTLDAGADEVYVGSDDGVVHALRASDGSLRWRAQAGASVRSAPILVRDSVVVVTENDIVIAFGRKTGEILWRYQREPPGGFAVAGHAGLSLVGPMLITGFTDGVVAALNATDGQVRWEIDTSEDVPEAVEGIPRFLDVDTTPLHVGQEILVASITAGVYALDAATGSIQWRSAQLTGVSHMTLLGDRLFLSSSDYGVVCIDAADHRVLWRRPIERGAPSPSVAAGPFLLVGETKGALLALSGLDGHEVNRIEYGSGFSATPVIGGDRAFVVSNGGSLIALAIQRADD